MCTDKVAEKCSNFLVNGQTPNVIKIKYKRDTKSLYSGSPVSISCNSMKQCSGISNDRETEEYNALDDGFQVVTIEVKSKVLMSQEDGVYTFPESSSQDAEIIHGPADVCGYELDNPNCIILGIITRYPNTDKCLYTWYKNETVLCSGSSKSILTVSEAGEYNVTVCVDDSFLTFDTPVIVEKVGEVPTEDEVNLREKQDEIHATKFRGRKTVYASTEKSSTLVISEQEPLNPTSLYQNFQITTTEKAPTSVNSELEPLSLPPLNKNFQISTQSSLQNEYEKMLDASIRSIAEKSSSSENVVKEMEIMVQPAAFVIEQQLMSSSEPLNQNLQFTAVSSESAWKSMANQMQSAAKVSEPQQLLSSNDPPTIQVNQSFQVMTSNDGKLVKEDSSFEIGQQEAIKLKNTEASIECDPNVSFEKEKKADTFQKPIIPAVNLDADLIEVKDLDLVSKIGEGAFGEVFKATWLGTTVAVKRIKVKRMKVMRNMIMREIQMHQQIRHSNIILFLCYALSKDCFYIVSEMVKGSNLDDIIFSENGRDKLNIESKLVIAGEICKAVTYLHNKGIIHRDIKQENVLVSKNLSVVKLCDLGVSKMELAKTLITTASSGNYSNIPGTPVYQAPELFLGRSKAAPASDIWSLACTFSEMFSEEPIWSIDSTVEDTLSIIKSCMNRQEKPNGFKELEKVKEIKREWLEVIAKGLKYEAQERPLAVQVMQVFVA